MFKRLRYWILNFPNLPMMIAFRVLRRSLASDRGFAWGWHCNVAMASVDEGMEHAAANRAAARFMNLCFGVDTSRFQQYVGLGIARRTGE